MVLSLLKPDGWRRLAADAAVARHNAFGRRAAAALVVLYNLVGGLDIVSTHLAISSGAGEEANPVMDAAMAHLGHGWIVAKLFLQGVVSLMVIWFPHLVVMGLFLIAVSSNAMIVANNFLIYYHG